MDALRSSTTTAEFDVMLFVEPPARGTPAFGALLELGYKQWPCPVDRFAAFSRFDSSLARTLPIPSRTDRFVGWGLQLPGYADLNVFLTHISDRRNNDGSDRELDIRALVKGIGVAERLMTKHSRTLLVGDFNDNPFDANVVGLTRLNATNSKRVALSLSRKRKGLRRKYFYNASWQMMCDTDGVAGTYYQRSPSAKKLHWHTLDQVLVRPSLVAALVPGSVCALRELGGLSLLSKRGRPDGSDHLPVTLSLDLTKIASETKHD